MTHAAVPEAALVTVGDELLLGRTLDTNAAWLGQELAALGVVVRVHHTVGDDAHDIKESVRDALRGTDLVVVTGGLGPTRDDLTLPAVAELLGRRLVQDAALLARLERRFREGGFDRLPEPNRSQALVPEGARILPNTRGTAPGLALEQGDALVVLLPGVPQEMRGIFQDVLRDLLEVRFGARLAPVLHRTLHTTGIPESRLAELVEEVLPADLGPVSIAFLPDPLGVDLRLTARGAAADASRRVGEIERLLRPVLAEWTFEAPSGDLAESLIERLRGRGATLAVAESCTGGLLGHRVTSVPGASEVFLGGVIAYADEVKIEMLGVRREDILADGAVSRTVACAMASGVRERFGADAGAAITGVAGPAGGSPAKPVGTVWCAVSLSGETRALVKRFPGDRVGVQQRAAQEALRLLHAALVPG